MPAFSLNTTTSGLDDISIPEIEPMKRLDAAFPGGNDPAVVAIKADDVRAPEVQDAIVALKQKALATGQLSGPIEVEASRDNTVATVDITLAGSGTDAESQAALATLREDVVPSTIGKVDGVEYAVGGTTALDKDWEDGMKTSAPLVFGFVLLFAFLIMLVSFRSIVVALKAILLNLLSVGAAYGILVAVFQWGWGESLLDFQSNGGITPWLPMFLFVILFGLSMDYHVFVLSRVREAYRPRSLERRSRRPRDQVHGRCRHQRRRRHGRHLLGVRPAAGDRHEGDGHRARSRDPDRRDADPRGAPPRHDEAARRQELVPAEVARLAPPPRARGSSARGAPRAARGVVTTT